MLKFIFWTWFALPTQVLDKSRQVRGLSSTCLGSIQVLDKSLSPLLNVFFLGLT